MAKKPEFEAGSHAWQMRIEELNRQMDEDQRVVDEREGWIETAMFERDRLLDMAKYPIFEQVIEVDGDKWLIKKAVTMAHAENAIAHARCSGSVGASWCENDKTMAVVERAE